MQASRTAPPGAPPPAELHVWQADLARLRRDPRPLLSAAEHERAARFLTADKGRMWALSRGLLRALLGAYLQRDPRALSFGAGEHGKPRLRSPGAPELSFNLSHAGTLAVYAFAAGCEVGVDVESAGREPDDIEAVAARAFGPEQAARLSRLDRPRRREAFLRAWVRHEARQKCRGSGLAARRPPAPDEPWVSELEVPGAFAAVAAERAPRRLIVRSTPDLARIPFA